jgi:hypothetical protein
MADEGTFLGEIQRGWQRFWRLSWWWKAPAILFVALILTTVAGGIASGGRDEKKSDSQVRATTTVSATASPTATKQAASPTATKQAASPTATKQTASPKPTTAPTRVPTADARSTLNLTGYSISTTDYAAYLHASIPAADGYASLLYCLGLADYSSGEPVAMTPQAALAFLTSVGDLPQELAPLGSGAPTIPPGATVVADQVASSDDVLLALALILTECDASGVWS